MIISLKKQINLFLKRKNRFPESHHLFLKKRNAIFSHIPKNASSTINYSISIDNQLDLNPREVQQNIKTLRANKKNIANAEYFFIVLRCPFERVASYYLDKICKGDLTSLYLLNNFLNSFLYKLSRIVLKKKIESYLSSKILNITFQDFVNNLIKIKSEDHNVHLKKQVEFFLNKKTYDLYCVENFDYFVNTINKKIGLKIIDTRKHLKHDTSHYTLIPMHDAYNLQALEIKKMMKKNKIVSKSALLNKDLLEKLARYYYDDVNVYVNNFGEKNIKFNYK